MPQPASGTLHQNVPLQNMTVAAMHDDISVALFDMAPALPVEKQSDVYYEYDTGQWLLDDMQLRASGAESAGSGWKVSNTAYNAKAYAVHVDVDPDDNANADDAVKPERDAAAWLQQKWKIKADRLCADVLFKTGVWTTEVDGTAGSATEGTDFKFWDNSAGEPQKDILWGQEQLRSLIGRRGNVLVVGAAVERHLLANAAVREALKYTRFGTVEEVRGALAAYLGVEKLVVAETVYNSAKEGQTASLAFAMESKDAWLGYIAPNPGLRTMSAAYTFVWNGGNGLNTEGVRVRSFEIPERNFTMRHELDWYADVQVVAADAGVYFDAAVS